MDAYLIGIDNGGTLSKAALFDLRGRELAVASRQTESLQPRPGHVERDMEALWSAACACLRELMEKSGVPPDKVLAIAACGHGKGLYAWGKDDRPAYRGIASTDSRAWQLTERWNKDGTWRSLYPRLCQALIPCQQASLLAWMKEHERGVYDDIRWVFSVKDYVRFRLTGEAYSELTDISGSGLFDVAGGRLDRSLLESLGIGEAFDKLAPLRGSFDLCGKLSPEAASATGLLAGTPVAGGMFDIDACAVAMDIHSPEQLCAITGTWSINEFISPRPITDSKIAMNSLYAVPGYYLLEECSPTGAGNLDWALGAILGSSAEAGPGSVYDRANELVSAVDPAESEVYYLPYLYGSATHPLAKGSFVGLSARHGAGHMLRAVYEGVVFSHKTHIDRLLSVREDPPALRMAGGAANSALWVQIFADALGFPVETVGGVKELGALGAAMAAAVAVGAYPDHRAAAKAMVRVAEPVPPDPAKTEVYARKYATYTAVREALEPIWGRFA